MNHNKDVKEKRLGAKFVFGSYLIYVVLFSLIFFSTKSFALNKFNAANKESLGIYFLGGADKFLSFFSSYGFYIGLGIGLVAVLFAALFYAIFRNELISIILGYGGWLALSIELVFFENRYTAWANGIIFLIGLPMLMTLILFFIIILAIVIIFNFSKSKPRGEN